MAPRNQDAHQTAPRAESKQRDAITDDRIYEERVTSPRTTALFVVLMLLFLLLFVWRATTTGLGLLSILFLCLFLFFAFYALNYRTLIIRLTREALTLTFGIFTWTTPIEDIAGCSLDPVSLWRIGGAGIHFTWIRRRYRAMFNVLEYPRVVVALKKRRGPVWDIVFSTRRPDYVISTMMEALAEQNTALHSPDRPDAASAAADGRAEPG